MREIKHLSGLRSAIPDSQQPTSPIGFLFLKLPPPPCAVLLVRVTRGQPGINSDTACAAKFAGFLPQTCAIHTRILAVTHGQLGGESTV